jgi:hypothetical protein
MISITVQVDDHKPFVMESDWKACWDSFDRSIHDTVPFFRAGVERKERS